MADPKAHVADLFSAVAAGYDSEVEFFGAFGRALAAAADLEPGDKVLDLAPGRGAVMFPVLEAVGPEGSVLGVRARPARPLDGGARARLTSVPMAGWDDIGRYEDRNVLGGPLEPCSADPVTGFYRDGCCTTGPEDLGSHTICAVMTEEFLAHQRSIGNDLSTPMPDFHFPGLVPGDRWCVTARNWARAYNDGVAAPVVLASTNAAVLELIPLEALQELAVDVPDDPSALL